MSKKDFFQSLTGVSLLIGASVVLLAAFAIVAMPMEAASTGSPLPESAPNLSGARLGAGMVPNASEPSKIYFPVITRPPIDLKELITKTTITLPHLLFGTSSSYCTWGGCGLGPRLYHEPLPDDRTLLGWSDLDIHDLSSDGHVSVIAGEVLEETFDFEGLSVRGLTAHADGSFAVLLWDKTADIMFLSKRDPDGIEIWTTNLNTTISVADFAAGDGRLTYGNGLYGAYFTVYGVSGGVTGHHGDQLTYVNDDGVKQPGGWNFGCSHSMAELISYHPELQQFVPVCSSDCNKIGILTNRKEIVYKGDGDCAGLVSTQLGQVALGVDSWKLVFNAMERPCCEGKGVALATIDASYQSSYTWLTDTTGLYEADPSLARLGTDLNLDQYLVGWMTTDDGEYYLGVVDGEGSFVVSPQAVSSAGVIWGARDDSFRTRFDGSVSWVDGYHVTNLTHDIHLYRFDASIFTSP
jgi:hypothetical protein